MRDGWVWTDEESTSEVLVMGWDDEDEDEDEDWEEWEEEFEEDEDDPLNRKKPGRPKWD